MIIDVNAYLGHFAFRHLQHNTTTALLRLMDKKGIDMAVVSNAGAITYRNPQPGNEELHVWVKSHRDRLIPFAVINPFYAAWENDLKVCHQEFEMIGIRIYPKWHNYALSEPSCLHLMNLAGELGMIVSIPICVEDRRQRSWLVDVPDVPLEEIPALLDSCPKTQFVLLNGIGFTGSRLGNNDNCLPSNYFIEISRLSALMNNEIGHLIQNLGAERIVFGTGMPFKYPDPSLLKLDVLAAKETEKESIRWRNAAKLLQLPDL